MSSAARQLPDDDRRAYTIGARDQQAIDLLRYFVFFSWVHLNPGRRLIPNWHIWLICDELQDFTRPLWDPTSPDPEDREMVTCVPPRSLKSFIAAICLQAWIWLHAPWVYEQNISNDEDLAGEHSRKTLELVLSPWYQRLVRHKHLMDGGDPGVMPWTISTRQAAKTNFENTAAGGRNAFGTESKIIGRGGDLQLMDDLLDAKAATRGTPQAVRRRMDQIKSDHDDVWPSRLNDPNRSLRLMIAQRLDPNDPPGFLLKRGVRRLVLPMEYDPEFPEEYGGVHPKDPRTEPGELLMPARWSPKVWAAMKAVRAANRHLEAQYNQRPRPKEGGLFKVHWFEQRYPEDPQLLRVDEVCIFVDATFKETADGSFVVMQAWGRRGKAYFYLLDQVRERMEFYVFLRVLLDFRKKWHRARQVLLEDKANGPATVSILKRDVPGIDEWPCGTKGKYERAEIGSVPSLQAGQVWFPSDTYAPWMAGYIERHVAFDGQSSVPDDEVDTTSMALLKWTGGGEDPIERLRRQLPADVRR